MPRRGEHHAARAVRPATAAPDAAGETAGLAGPGARVGVRAVQSRHRDTVRTYRIDPQAFSCSLRAGQLADEWVRYARVTALADGSRYAVTIRSFAAFAGRWCLSAGADPGAARLDGGPVDLTAVIRDWQVALRQEHDPRSEQPYQSTVALFTLIGQRAARDPGVDERLRALAASRPMFGKGAATPLDEFSNAERLALRKMARADITALEARLARGQALLADGADPRLHGWDEPANLVWAARHGILTTAALHAGLPAKAAAWPAGARRLLGVTAGHWHGRFGLMTAVGRLLFPCEQDLHPFRVLLLLAMTGCTPEELADLRLSDIEFSDGAVRLRQAKDRAGRVRIRLHPPSGPEPAVGDRVHHGSGNWDIPGLIRRLLAVTALARETFEADDWLFLAVEARDYDTRLGAQAAQFRQAGRRFTHWIAAHADADGVPPAISAPYDARRLRKTAKTTRVAALGGTLTDLAGDDHHVEVFRGHYAHGTTAHVLAARAVNAAQGKVFEKTRARPVFLDAEAESRLADPEVAGAAGLSAGQAAAMSAGALDMGLTNCRDPYDSPHAPAGTLCHVAPVMCMLCRNAVVFTAQLPRLVQLADHIQGQRDVLDPPRWQAVWGRQAAALAELFDACPEETAQARSAAAAGRPLDLPLGMRTEYHR
jgi:integrase